MGVAGEVSNGQGQLARRLAPLELPPPTRRLARPTYPADKGLCALRHVCGELQVDLGDAAVRLVVALSLKRRLAHEKLVAEHTQCPEVHLHKSKGGSEAGEQGRRGGVRRSIGRAAEQGGDKGVTRQQRGAAQSPDVALRRPPDVALRRHPLARALTDASWALPSIISGGR